MVKSNFKANQNSYNTAQKSSNVITKCPENSYLKGYA